ncbi:putative Fe-S cluster assembly protein SufT [Reinekea marinisedimentorum]|uniref:Putative FeS assembly SUF system protein SufT n=1 Tax=Reinekea marinisedimentorum TaxID=230495 RepID=A0A4R3IA41_9GAMM|nr:putative Fe-S cluster assembly protein SufT [Reinekea marinisedimentorum]TCS42014.1 putative FeS assembly SUF system protein SufT [Reinekea marinisedimentorum]
MERRVVVTTREVNARLVPVGTPIVIPSDTFVTLTQALGGTYTVVHQGNMARIDGTDADALGFEAEKLDFSAVEGDEVVEDQVWYALSTVFDPEIPVSIVALGLVYSVDIAGQEVNIKMTLTAPGCGMGPVLVDDVKYRVAMVPNVASVNVELVFDPPWHRDMMTEEAQLETGMFF